MMEQYFAFRYWQDVIGWIVLGVFILAKVLWVLYILWKTR
jgi:hypothetical protein